MPENVLSFPGVTAGAYDLYIESNGQHWNGTAFETIVNANWANYALSMTQQGTTGIYNRSVPPALPASPRYGFIVRKRASLVAAAAPTDEIKGCLITSWDGINLGADVAAVKSDTGTLVAGEGGGIDASEVVVDDAAPTVGGFIIAMADGADVPDTFVWRGGLACFAEDSVLSNGKFPIATYTKLTAKTARITFTPSLPVAPADGEEIQVL